LAILLGGLLVIASLFANTANEYIRERMDRWEQKAYFETVLSKKGLSLREAKYWKPARKNGH